LSAAKPIFYSVAKGWVSQRLNHPIGRSSPILQQRPRSTASAFAIRATISIDTLRFARSIELT
jgi:hypothetical protein